MTEGTVSPARTFGAFAVQPASYPFKLQTLMTARYTTQTVVVTNDGWAGKRATEDRGRLNSDLSETKPEVLLLMHGANDMLALDTTTGPALDAGITATVSAVEDLIRDATGRAVRVMLATLPPVVQGLPKGGAARYLSRYNDQLKAMAAKKGAQIVDLNALVPPALVGQDGLHLSEAGYQRVAEVFLEAIAAAYDVSAAIRSA